MANSAAKALQEAKEKYAYRLRGLKCFKNPNPFPVTFGHSIGRGVAANQPVVDDKGTPLLDPRLFYYVDKHLLLAIYDKPQEAAVKSGFPVLQTPPSAPPITPPTVPKPAVAEKPKAQKIAPKAEPPKKAVEEAPVKDKPKAPATPVEAKETLPKAAPKPLVDVVEATQGVDYVYNGLGKGDDGYFIEVPFEAVINDDILTKMGEFMEIKASALYKNYGGDKHKAVTAAYNDFLGAGITLSSNRLVQEWDQ